jgi:BolA family transcriptional regulator, general stress-responsive regulator
LSIPAANPQRIARMRELLQVAFAPVALDIVDDSHRHIGHAGARDGQGHFTVDIVSESFAGQSLVARHQAVYAALGDMLSTDIHALSIRATTPAERSQA